MPINFGELMTWGNRAILAIFIVEAALKMLALAPKPQRYFRRRVESCSISPSSYSRWCLRPEPSRWSHASDGLLRVLRLISTIQDLRLIVAALVKSIPNVGHILMLMSIIVYIYAIIGYQLFHEHDPENWRNIGIAVLTLFEIITLEGWIDVNAKAMELSPYAWIYFVTYVIVGTFVVVNLFIAVVINNLRPG